MAGAGVTEEERAVIEVQLRTKLAACDAAADCVDLPGVLAHYRDRFGLGFIHTGTFFPNVDAILAAMSEGFARLRNQRHDTDRLRIAVLAPDIALMSWHGVVSATDADGVTRRLTFGRTFVCVKVEDEWEFVHLYASHVPQKQESVERTGN